MTLLLALLSTSSAATCPARAADVRTSADASLLTDARLDAAGVLLVLQADRLVGVYDHGALRTSADGTPACWTVALGVRDDGVHPDGPKLVQGDRKTPIGWYRTSDRPWSSFHHAITIHYPSPADAERGLHDGLITTSQRDAIIAADRKGTVPPESTRLGGAVLFHGGGSSADWTWGCVALDDDDLERLRDALPAGMRTYALLLP